MQDWLRAENDYLLQRPADGTIPLKQRLQQDTVERRAYEIYRDRSPGDAGGNPGHPAPAAVFAEDRGDDQG